ncbi:Ig-like domain (group 2) [Oscillospiraceae bacterium]|nr:Ig-like domain (group 2) [Oscillospiraceae bacterium]
MKFTYGKLKRRVTIIGVMLMTSIILSSCGVKRVDITKTKIEITKGENYKIDCVIDPESYKGKAVWNSSDNDVVTVNEIGNLRAVGVGECEVTVTVGEMSDSVTVVVRYDFNEIYDKYCDSSWATVASDNSYLTIDTNPSDIDDYNNRDAILAIMDVNEALGLPESVWNDMNSIRALDGRISQTYDGITVSYSYHPDHGLLVTYSYD